MRVRNKLYVVSNSENRQGLVGKSEKSRIIGKYMSGRSCKSPDEPAGEQMTPIHHALLAVLHQPFGQQPAHEVLSTKALHELPQFQPESSRSNASITLSIICPYTQQLSRGEQLTTYDPQRDNTEALKLPYIINEIQSYATPTHFYTDLFTCSLIAWYLCTKHVKLIRFFHK